MRLDNVSRREALALGAAATTSLAGCIGGSGSNEEVSVSLLLPFSGPAQSLGEGMADGARIAIEESDLDAEFNVFESDTEADPQTGLNELQSAIEREGADFVIGPVSTGVANAIRDTIEQNDVFWLNCNAGSNALGQGNCSRFHYRPSFSNWQQSYPFGKWIGQNTDHQTAAILAADYGAGHEYAAGFTEGFTEEGGEVISESFTPLGTSDYSSQLTDVEGQNPDFVYTFYYGLDEVNFVTQYDEFGLKSEVPLYQSFGPTRDILGDIGESAEGVTSFCHYTPTWDIGPNNDFRSVWIDEHDAMPTEWNVQGADAANLMLEAIGSVDGDLSNTDDVIETLSGIEWTGPRGDLHLDSANNNVVLDMQVRETVAEENEAGDPYQNKVVDVVEDTQLPSDGCNL